MKVQMLKSKLQQVVVTESNVNYKGSITIDPVFMEAAGFYPYERVEVNNSTNGSRITTYVIPGERGSGCIKMNGGAALHAKVGDKVHVLSYCEVSKWKAKKLKPKVILTFEETNKPFIFKKGKLCIITGKKSKKKAHIRHPDASGSASAIKYERKKRRRERLKYFIPFFGLYCFLRNLNNNKLDKLFHPFIGAVILYLYHVPILTTTFMKVFVEI